jgi:NADPH-ferrihemoprotein reductase
LQKFSAQLGDTLKIVTAFSRETSEKVYVQHKIRENATLVNELLQKKANFYVCGDAANMAREVNVVLGQIMAEQRGLKPEKGEDLVKHMRSSGSYQEDVWS